MRLRGGAVAGVVLAASLSAPGAASRTQERRGAPARIADAHPTAFFDLRTFALAEARVGRRPAVARDGVRGLLVPHHWLPADLIVEAFRDLAAGAPVRRVVLIGPNHIGAGGAAFITSRLPWRTPFGIVEPDRESIERLVGRDLAEVMPRVLSGEHSIAGLVPVIASFFPDATVVPIAVRAHPEPAQLEGLVAALGSLLDDPATVMVTSVDFSHYRSVPEAAHRDAESIAAMASLETGTVLGFGNEHMDSPASIALLIETMRSIGAERFDLWRNATSADFGGRSLAPEVTSYVTGAFRKV